MDHNSRPVMIASLGQDERGYCFKTPSKRIGVRTEVAVSIVAILNEATGHKAIAQLANEVFDEKALTSFFSQLEEVGLCYEAHHVALHGHYAACYPDRLRVYPGDEEVVHLMQLPPDRDGELVRIAHAADESLRLHERRTCRSFGEEPVSIHDLSKIAYAAYGITGSEGSLSRRTVPSAGAMYPLQIDYIIRQGAGIERGIYRWAKRTNALIRYRSIADDDLREVFLNGDWQEASVIQVIGFDIKRSAAKYSSRAHRFALLEAGHVAQNSILQAVSLGLGVWEHGGYVDEHMTRLVELEGITSGIATVLFYGHPAEGA